MSNKGKPINGQSRLNPSLPRGTLADGQVPQWSGQAWVPSTPAAAVIAASGGTGTVTSVGLVAPKEFVTPVSGSPITSAGTLTLEWLDQAANKVFAGPASGAATQPGYRSLVAEDLAGLSGTYMPTLTGVANVSASTAYTCQYARIGSFVMVSGKLDIDPLLTATATRLGISFPVASALAADEQCGGTAYCPTVAAMGGAILGDVANARAELRFVSSDINNNTMHFTFSYLVQ